MLNSEVFKAPTVNEPIPTPEDLFAAHVNKIRQDGDLIDSAPWHGGKLKRIGVAVAAEAVLGQAMPNANSEVTLIGAGAALGFIAVAVCASGVTFGFSTNKRINAAMQPETLQAVGHDYELYRAKDQETVFMRWYGATENKIEDLEPKTAGESIVEIALLAKDQVSAILVEPGLIQQAFDQVGQLETFNAATSSAPLIGVKTIMRHKGIKIRLANGTRQVDDVKLMGFTPSQLETLGRRLKPEYAHSPPLRQQIEKLRLFSSEHPLVAAYDEYSQYDSLLQPKLLAISAKCITRRLENVQTIFALDGSLLPTRDKTAVDVRLKGDTVEFISKGYQQGVPKTVRQALGLTESDLLADGEVLATYGNQRAVTILEAAIYLNILEARPVEISDQDKTEPLIYADTPKFLQAVESSMLDGNRRTVISKSRTTQKAEIALVRNQYKRLAAMGLITGLSLSAGVIAVNFDDVLVAAYDQQLAVEQRGDTLPDDWKQNGIRLYGEFAKKEEEFIKNTPVISIGSDSKNETANSANGNINFNGIGNQAAGNKSALQRPVWTLQADPGVSSEGYYPRQTTNYFDNRFVGLASSPVEFAAASQIDLPPEPLPGQTGLLEISGTPQVGFLLSGVALALPVRQDSWPVAGNYAGEKLRLFQQADGTYVSELSEKQIAAYNQGKAALHLWMYTVASYTTVHATAPMQFLSFDETENDKQPPEVGSSEYQDLWRRAIPNLSDSPDTRLRQQVDYMTSDAFTYSFAPLPSAINEMMREGKLSYPQFLEETLKAKKAICNTAAAAVALSNPQVNEVSGFYNNGDNTLTVGEAHAWLTNTAGDTIDPTPHGKDSLLNDNQKDVSRNHELQRNALLLAAALLTTAAVYAGRRSVASGLQKVVVAHSRLRVRRLLAKDLVLAQRVIGAGLFSENPVNAVEKTTQLTTPRPHQDISRDRILEQLAKPFWHSPQTTQELKRLGKQVKSPHGRQAVVAANRILRHIRRAGLAQSYARDPADVLLDLL